MSVVVSDTSPLNYVFFIGQVDLLRSLYGRVQIPDIVLMELRAAGSPSPVAVWASALSEWVEVVLTEGEETDSNIDAG